MGAFTIETNEGSDISFQIVPDEFGSFEIDFRRIEVFEHRQKFWEVSAAAKKAASTTCRQVGSVATELMEPWHPTAIL